MSEYNTQFNEINQHFSQMEKKERKERLKRYFFWVLVGVSAASAVYCSVKMHQSNRYFKDAASRINDMTSVDVPQAIIDDAVEAAASKQIAKAVEKSVNKVRDAVDLETSRRVRDAVDLCYVGIRDDVTKEVKKEVFKISADAISREIRDDVKDQLLERLENKFDDIIDDVAASYTKNLDSMSKIYKSMADKMAENK